MRRLAFCDRCRGMRVGWNRTYVLHCLICKELFARSFKTLIFGGIFSSFIFAFPISTEILSDMNPALHFTPPVAEAAAAPIVDPAVADIERLLAIYRVHEQHRVRIAKAVVENSRKYKIDPKLVASVVIVESTADPFAVSGASAIGVMQIHVPTWGSTADKENINLFKVEDNVALGVRILKDYVTRYGLWGGVMRYRGWTDSLDSQQEADEYVQKVRHIYQPEASPTAIVETLQ